VRWNLVRDVEGAWRADARYMAKDETAYLKTLTGFIEAPPPRDRARRGRGARQQPATSHAGGALGEVEASHAGGKTLSSMMSPSRPSAASWSISDDGRIRVDNTFEGRLARLRESASSR
jgi:V/A-type H+-transporting ATPase subunit E